MISLKNYFKETSPKVKKFGLWLKGIIGTAVATTYIQNDIKTSFYLTIAGAVVTGLLECLPPDLPGDNSGTPPVSGNLAVVAIAAFALMVIAGCTVVRPGTNTIKTDSTYTTFKQVDIKVKGAKVFAGINIDSLYHAALMARDQAKDDSIGRLNAEVIYRNDSIAALRANKPAPQKPIYKTLPPKINTVIDPNTKAQLDYWVDAYGKFQITCESKDQTIQTLQTQVNKLSKQISNTTVAVSQTPVWAWVVMSILGIAVVVLGIILTFKSIV